uniref:Transcription factor CBF/NF-Y/archaeal histone domain-containing protein n=1 Tax=Physcomitrium patens TaxID=3218 RepID=A0A7I4AGS3_PHYPA
MATQHAHVPPSSTAQMSPHAAPTIRLQQQMHYPNHAPHQQQQLHYQQIQKQQLAQFWAQQTQEMEEVNDSKTHQLPLARIKKIMKSDEDVKMIATEAPVLFSKACEMFILELTLRSWIHTEENKRRTLQRNDIAGAITRGDIFDFLVDIVPRDELKEEDLGVPWSGVPADGVQYGGMYYPPMPGQPIHPMRAPRMMVGQPAVPPNPQMMYQSPLAVLAPEQQQQPQQQLY